MRDIAPPVPGPGEVVVDVERCGVCGTDVEFFTGEMAYLHSGEAAYPIRLGHEWAGRVASVGDGVDPSWIGRRVTGDTMLGCGRCRRCVSGRQHLCADRHEIGIRNGWPGALAEQLPVPVGALVPLGDPDPTRGAAGELDPTRGALVEPGGNALRAVRGAALSPGQRLLVLGPGTIGLLVGLIAASQRIEVHLLGKAAPTVNFARDVGFTHVWDRPPEGTFDAVVDATNDRAMPGFALDAVEPGGRVVYIGLSGEPSLVDSRRLVLTDVTAVGVLSASGALADTAARYADGGVDPAPLVAATVGLDEVADVLAGQRRPEWGAAPKVHVNPRG
ncbi:alcohol dehydrogenase [Virgisporangium aliadipatigenens]|uniref:Alcohol dehydrogenase n=1 Tax=Virgisporangium aliadipatigenens TaxID=741659 RepID=A0A8J3YI21_9ACTN|nr:alcohol dehydrogenase [Virgisporangium aliadipatigenens]